jgi:hypothetical protein
MMFPKPKHQRPKSEKIQKIKMQERRECWVSKRTDGLQLHHVIHGNGKRKLSDKYGLTVWLRPEWHTGNQGVHFNPVLDMELKQEAQRRFEQVYGHEKWMAEFGRDYL